MKKEYVVVRIDAAPDGGPYVQVSFVDQRDLKDSSQPRFSPQIMGLNANSMDDLMKNMQKAFGGMSRQMGGSTTTIKMDMREYEDSGLKVGDKATIEINRVEQGV